MVVLKLELKNGKRETRRKITLVASRDRTRAREREGERERERERERESAASPGLCTGSSLCVDASSKDAEISFRVFLNANANDEGGASVGEYEASEKRGYFESNQAQDVVLLRRARQDENGAY